MRSGQLSVTGRGFAVERGPFATEINGGRLKLSEPAR